MPLETVPRLSLYLTRHLPVMLLSHLTLRLGEQIFSEDMNTRFFTVNLPVSSDPEKLLSKSFTSLNGIKNKAVPFGTASSVLLILNGVILAQLIEELPYKWNICYHNLPCFACILILVKHAVKCIRYEIQRFWKFHVIEN